MVLVRDSLISRNFIGEYEKALTSDGEASILTTLLRANKATQADLTESLSFSQQSISRMLSNLSNRGMVNTIQAKGTGTRGQPSKFFQINANYAFSIGAALKADGMTVVLSNFAAEVIDSISPEMSSMKSDIVLPSMESAIEDLITRNGIPNEKVFGIGISTSGFHTGKGNACYNTPESLNDFAIVDLDEYFTRALNIPAWSENDGNAATIAENFCGHGRQYTNFAYYYFATGLGGGVVTQGKLFRGVNGNAGEYRGILPLENMPPPTLENLRIFLNNNGATYTRVCDIVNNYSNEIEGIDAWVKTVLPSLSLMVSATSALLDTEVIIFGGEMPEGLKSKLMDHLEFFDINRRGIKRQTANIINSKVKGDAAAIGASFLPFLNKFYRN